MRGVLPVFFKKKEKRCYFIDRIFLPLSSSINCIYFKRLYLTKGWFIGLLERRSPLNSQNFFGFGKEEDRVMKKTYKVLVNITGTEKVYKIKFDNRSYRNEYEKEKRKEN